MIPEDWGKAENSISCALMRPVSGFERPGLQWLFVAFALVLIAVAATEAVAVRRARWERTSLRAAELNQRVELDQLRAQAARERAARESFALELARERRRGAAPSQPTLTLSPLSKRGAHPPEPTVGKPADDQSIQLRLLLPRENEAAAGRYTIVIRTWSGGDLVWSRGGLQSTTIDKTRMVACFITGDVFAPGAYEIALTRASADKGGDVAAYEVAIRP
jgi:hypothetical protein